eukprot:3568751-Karenia_brevis.AAC.1
MNVDFVGGGSTEITVGSGAEESVCPWEWGQQFGCRVASEPMKLRNASGKTIPHWGSRLHKQYPLFEGWTKCR